MEADLQEAVEKVTTVRTISAGNPYNRPICYFDPTENLLVVRIYDEGLDAVDRRSLETVLRRYGFRPDPGMKLETGYLNHSTRLVGPHDHKKWLPAQLSKDHNVIYVTGLENDPLIKSSRVALLKLDRGLFRVFATPEYFSSVLSPEVDA